MKCVLEFLQEQPTLNTGSGIRIPAGAPRVHPNKKGESQISKPSKLRGLEVLSAFSGVLIALQSRINGEYLYLGLVEFDKDGKAILPTLQFDTANTYQLLMIKAADKLSQKPNLEAQLGQININVN